VQDSGKSLHDEKDEQVLVDLNRYLLPAALRWISALNLGGDRSSRVAESRVVDPNWLCSDPDPGFHVHLDPAPEPSRIRIDSEPDPNAIFQNSSKFSSQLKSEFICRQYNLLPREKSSFTKCIRILSAPDPNQLFGFGSGSCKKVVKSENLSMRDRVEERTAKTTSFCMIK